MESLFAVRSFLGDSYWALPVLLIGFAFLYGSITSNIGLLLLALGQVFFGNFANLLSNNGYLWKTPTGTWQDRDTLVKHTLTTVLGLASFLGFTTYMFGQKNLVPAEDDPKKKVVNKNVYWWTGIASVLTVLPAFVPPLAYASSFDALGIYPFFTESRPLQGSPGCTLFPPSSSLTESAMDASTRPTAWTSHIVFLYGFLVANGVALVNTEEPGLQNEADLDKETRAARNAKIEERYANRRSKTALIIALLTVVFGLLLLFRYWKTGCEDSIVRAAPALVFTGLFGASWYTFLTGECGVLPTDVLGFAAGMKSPDLTENPIVCVGSTS